MPEVQCSENSDLLCVEHECGYSLPMTPHILITDEAFDITCGILGIAGNRCDCLVVTIEKNKRMLRAIFIVELKGVKKLQREASNCPKKDVQACIIEKWLGKVRNCAACAERLTVKLGGLHTATKFVVLALPITRLQEKYRRALSDFLRRFVASFRDQLCNELQSLLGHHIMLQLYDCEHRFVYGKVACKLRTPGHYRATGIRP